MPISIDKAGIPFYIHDKRKYTHKKLVEMRRKSKRLENRVRDIPSHFLNDFQYSTLQRNIISPTKKPLGLGLSLEKPTTNSKPSPHSKPVPKNTTKETPTALEHEEFFLDTNFSHDVSINESFPAEETLFATFPVQESFEGNFDPYIDTCIQSSFLEKEFGILDGDEKFSYTAATSFEALEESDFDFNLLYNE